MYQTFTPYSILPFSKVLCSLAPSLLLPAKSSDELLCSVQFLAAQVNVGLQGSLLALHCIKLIIQCLQLVCGEGKHLL